jgi:diguanylate cyclase (GGDEF)-like protein
VIDLKGLVTDYLNKGTSPAKSNESNQQIIVANLFGFIGYSITFVLGTSALLRRDWLLGGVLLLASFLFFSSHLILRFIGSKNAYKISANLVTSSLMLLMVYLVYTGGNSNTGPLWIYIVPPVALFFGGMRKGTRNIGFFVLIISFLMFGPTENWLVAQYSFEFKSRLLYSFLTVTCLFAFYEYVRQSSFQRIKEMSDSFESQAMHDPLSGLLNRRGMLEELQSEFDRSRRYKNAMTVMMCDIDYFKTVNDKYGHDKGDEVIQSLAQLFQSLLRKQDSLARWGGEEYLFLLPETDAHQATQLAEKLRKKIEETGYKHNNMSFHVTVSLGIHQLRESDTVNQAISQADRGLYQAKEQGRNRCIVA